MFTKHCKFFPGEQLGTNGVANDTYIIDFEDALTSSEKNINFFWNVAVGNGVKYEGEGVTITNKVQIDSYTINKGKKVGGNSAVVISTEEEIGKALFVFPRNETFQGS